MSVVDLKELGFIGSITGLKNGSDKVVIECDYGKLEFFHEQDCCEHVRLIDCDSTIQIHGARMISVEETSQESTEACESGTWTFYNIVTTKGSARMRWLGESNGYYSESVSVKLSKMEYLFNDWD